MKGMLLQGLPGRRAMREKDITQKDFFTNEERFADFINAVCYHGRKISPLASSYI